MKRTLLFIFSILLCFTVFAQKSYKIPPQWVTKQLPEPKTPVYSFSKGFGQGETLEHARANALRDMIEHLKQEKGITVTDAIKKTSGLNRDTHNGDSETIKENYELTVKVDGSTINITTRTIDEYWEKSYNTYYCHVLYVVEEKNFPGGSYADNIKITTSYGASALFMSLIPGVGQLHKGSTLKGTLILGGTAGCATMLVVSENMRTNYKKKMAEKPSYKEFYSKEADKWENIRNGFFAGTAALYIYNLIDAAVASGRAKVVVKKNNRYNLNFALIPYQEYNNSGMRLVMNF